MDASVDPDRLFSTSAGPAAVGPHRPNNCLFEEDWWLDAVAPGAWQAVEVRSGAEVHARMAFGLSRTLGVRSIRQPPLTQTLGPWYRPTGGKPGARLAREKDLAEELIARLPPHGFFSLNFHHSVTNWLPFFWKGYNAAPKVTYTIDDLSDQSRLWQGLQQNIRREIRKAETRVDVQVSEDIEQFLELNYKTFARQGLVPPHCSEVVRRLDEACAARNTRRIYMATDEKGQVHGAIYVVFDQRCCYYLMGGGDPALRNSGAGSLLVWRAILDARRTSASFDFEGSMGESIERFFRGFGALQKTYLNVRRSGRMFGVVEGLRGAVRALVRG